MAQHAVARTTLVTDLLSFTALSRGNVLTHPVLSPLICLVSLLLLVILPFTFLPFYVNLYFGVICQAYATFQVFNGKQRSEEVQRSIEHWMAYWTVFCACLVVDIVTYMVMNRLFGRIYYIFKSGLLVYMGLPETGGWLAAVVSELEGREVQAERDRSRYGMKSRKKADDQVETVALVLDGFVGPEGVVCGILRSYDSWIREMVQQEKHVIIYSPFQAQSIEGHFGGRVKAHQLQALRMRYVEQEYYATSYTVDNIAFVYATLKAEQPDVVHVLFDGISPPLFSWACAVLNIPLIAIMHTDLAVLCKTVGLPQPLGQAVLGAQRGFAVGVDGIATRSRSFRRIMRFRGWNVDHVVKPHVNVDVFKPFQNEETKALREKFTFNHPEALLIMYAGRLDPDKRVDDLLAISERFEDVYLVFVGGGSMGEYLAAKHGEENHIFCEPGFVTHEALATMYNAVDLHITASQMETLGNTVLESLACGTPVLTPRAQGFVDTVHDDVDGMLWEPNDLDDAVRKLTAFMEDAKLRNRLESGARDVAERGALACSETIKDLLGWYNTSCERRAEYSTVYSNISLGLATFNLLGMALADISVIGVLKGYLERQNTND